MEKLGTIYKIENLVNGKVYIGQTKRMFKQRKDQHLYELRNGIKRNKKLQSAWNKYGEVNFKFVIIGRYPISELDEKEIYFIEKYDSFRNGYNMTTGGNQVMHNQKHTKEARKKMSYKVRKAWDNPSFRNKMSNRPVYYGEKSPRAKKVICINDGKVFGTLKKAGEYYGISLNRVSEVCLGKTEYTGLEETGKKLQFAFYEDGKQYQLKNINHVNEKKKVICITTGEVFDSISEAGEKTGAPKASISHVCKGHRKHAGKLPDGTKLKWAYYEDYLASK